MMARRNQLSECSARDGTRVPRWHAVLMWLGLCVALLMTAPTLAAAQATVTLDAYLHGSGGTTNPPTLTADLLPSISLTTKTQDSASIAFTGGNPWKVIGEWVPPAGSSASIKLNAFTSTHLWLGLKASGDVGGKVDLQAEILVNGQVVSTGLTPCISTLTASASTARDITATFSPIAQLTVNPATDTLAIRYSARMGTNTNGTACGTKSSVTGVRAYFDSLTRLSRVGITFVLPPPTPVALLPNPRTIHTGATGTLIAILFPAPLQAGTVTVASSNPAVATVPASVPVGTLQFLVPISVTGVSAGTSVITVTMNGKSAMSTVRVTGGAATITSLTPLSLSITQGGTGTLTVTINAVQSTNTVVSLASSASSVAAVPATVTVLAGQTTVPVPVSANTVGQADITASLNGSTATSHVTVTSVLPTVVSLLPPTSQVTLGASGTLTVTISSAQVTNTTVALAASPAGLVTLPPNVIVPANQTSATFQVTGAALGTAMLTASLNSSSVAAAVDVMPPVVQLTDLQPPTQNLVVGAIGTLTVSINAQQSSPTIVTLTVDQPTRLQIPPTVTVQPNQTSASFTVTALTTGTAQITATLGTVTKQATVTVIPQPPSVVSLLPSPLPVVQGATGTLTLTINAAQQTDTVVPLTNSSATIIDVPPSATIPGGLTETAVQVTGLTVGTATVTATLNGTAIATVQVVPPPVTITALGPVPPTPSPLTLAKGRTGVLRVTVNRVPLDPTIVNLSNSATSLVTVPPTVTVPAGALFADFPVTTQNEGTATITASLNSSSATADVVVVAPEVDALTVSPATPIVFATEPVQFTATATMTDGTTQPLTSNLTWTSSSTAVATIDNTGLATTLTAGITTIKAATSNALGPVTGETTLTVEPAPALTLAPVSGTLAVGQSLNLVVTSLAPAGPNGLTVNLVQTGTGIVTMVPTTIIPANGTTNSVVITGATFGQVTITASAVGRLPATATFTITPAAPTIAGFTPTSGPVGTPVTMTGTNLNGSGPGSSTVKFNTTNAIITSVSATSLTTTVPQGATTGFITITTPGGSAISAPLFTVVPRADFTLSAAPPQATAMQNGPGSYAITLTPTGNFTHLVNLSVANIPTGATARLSASTITANQTAILTVTPSSTTPAGIYPITLTGLAQLDSGPKTQTIPLNLVVLAGGGQTHVASQFLRPDDTPIPGIQLSIGTIQATTDAAGNFLLQNVPSGTQKLIVSGPTANGPFMYSLDIQLLAGQTNTIPPFYLPTVPPLSQFIPISNATANQVITDTRYPGLSMTLPAGVVIRGWDNSLKTGITIERLDPDRLGVPPPPKTSGAVYKPFFTNATGISPMGGYLEPTGSVIPVTIPNDLGLDPGEKAELWVYDATPVNLTEPSGWKLAGLGTVSADGSTIVADPGVGITRFCAACGIFTGCFPSVLSNLFNWVVGGSTDGDPVDLRTGLFPVTKTDLVLPGRFPISLSRTHSSFDVFSSGGPLANLTSGWTLSVDITLFPATISEDIYRLVLPGSSRLDLVRQPNGTWVNQTHPLLKGAVLSTLSNGDHQLRFKDGATWTFRQLFIFGAGGFVKYLIEQADRNENKLTINRTGTEITSIVDATGRQLTVTNASNHITQIADPIGRTVRYGYDSIGRLETVIDPNGGITRYTYGLANHITSITDAKGIAFVQNFYGPSGRVLRQVQADGGEWLFQYKLTGGSVTGPACSTATAVGPGGIIILIPAFPRGQCPTVDSWEAFQAGYSIQGGTVSETTVVDPRGNITTHRFNAAGFDSEVINPLGQRTTIIRNAANQVTISTDALGRATQFEYDAVGNVTRVTDPNSQSTRLEYEPSFNRVTKITNALNQITQVTYDAKGNLLTTTDPLNRTTTIAYNPFGQPITISDPLGNTASFEYDVTGNLVATTDPLGNRTQRVYDAVSRLITLTDPRGFENQFVYDSLNRVTQITDAINGLTSFTYDPNGNLLTVADAKNQTTTYTYDNMDRLATRKDALNRTESYQYDLAGNPITFTDRKNQQTTFVYDALNRRTTATYADGTTTFTYDSVGRLTKASDTAPGAGMIDFAYDTLDRLIQEVTGQGSVTYQYDVLGRRTQMVANGQQPVTYGYDAASQLTQVAQGSLAVGLGYDNANRRTSLTYPNGTSTSYGYDIASRLTNITHLGPSGIIEALTYTYDAAGNRFGVNRANGTASLLPNAVASATYDAANEQTAFAGATLTYDANGNLTNDGTNTYVWDARNRLVGITGGTIAIFSYDSLGRRVNKTSNGVVSQSLYDGNDIAAEIGGGAVGASYLRSLNVDEPFIRQIATGNEHYHTDALGSSLVLSDATGASLATYGYEPFGRTAATGPSSNTLRFTGRENDNTGLYYYRGRYYSPMMQRFISNDLLDLSEIMLLKQKVLEEMSAGQATPEDEDLLLLYSDVLSNPDLQHTYLYAVNNPFTYNDPTGEFVPQLVGCGIGAGISIGLDVLSGRKISLLGAGIGCLAGAISPRLLAEIPGGVGGRYLRIGYGSWPGQGRVPRVALGPSPWNKGKWWTHWRLYP